MPLIFEPCSFSWMASYDVECSSNICQALPPAPSLGNARALLLLSSLGIAVPLTSAPAAPPSPPAISRGASSPAPAPAASCTLGAPYPVWWLPNSSGVRSAKRVMPNL